MVEMIGSDVTADLTQRAFWTRWLPTFLGFIGGGALGTAVAGRLDSVGAALIGGALAGSVIGGVQWLVLRRIVPNAAWWVAATAIGQAIGLAIAAPLVDYGTGPGELAVQGAIMGLTIGIPQAVVLYRSGLNGLWWALAAPPLWTVGWLTTWAGRIDVDQQFFNFGGYGAITYTVLSGALLVYLMRSSNEAGVAIRPAVDGVV